MIKSTFIKFSLDLRIRIYQFIRIYRIYGGLAIKPRKLLHPGGETACKSNIILDVINR